VPSSIFSQFAWYELWGPIYVIICLGLCYLYFKKVVHYYSFHMTKNQINYFISAVILLYVVKGSPLATIADHYLFSAHMLLLSVIFFAIIPLFILSLPRNFIRKYFWHHRMKFFINVFGRPWLTAILFNGLVTIYFIPPIFNTIKGSLFLQLIAQIILTINAFLMWWVIISPTPEIRRTPYMTRAAYIFFASLLLMPIGIFLLVIQKEHYPFYGAVAGDFIPAITAIYDQQIAGGILKVMQLSSYTFALLHIVFMWGQKTDAKEGQVDDENIRYVRGVVIHLDEDKKR